MNPTWRGPVEGVRNLFLQWQAAGHTQEITCLDEPDAPWLKSPNLHVNATGPVRFGQFGYSSHLDSWLAANISRFDAVISNGIWMYFGVAVRRAALRVSIPYFVFTHGALDPRFERKYPHKQIKKQLYWTLFEHKILRDASAVLFTTAEELAASSGAFRPYRCSERVVGYGIADPFLSQLPSGNRPDARKQLKHALPVLGDRRFLLFLARIHEKKGIDLLLQAIAANRGNYQDHAFVIAGPGDQAYVSDLKGLGSQLGLDKQLIWAGPLYGNIKWSAIFEADAYILPSLQESFGVSVVEALACGVPVLITRKVNIWREIVEAGSGLVQNNDLNGVCCLLEQWSGISPEQRASMRCAARRCFLTHFDIANTSTRLFNLIAQAVTASHNATISARLRRSSVSGTT